MQLGVQVLGGVAFVVAALDGVLDLSQDALAGGGAVCGRVLGGCEGLGEGAGERDAAPDGAGDAVEGGGEGDQVWHRAGRGGCVGRPRGGGDGLVVQAAGEGGAHADEVVQDLAVVVRVGGLLGGVGEGGWVG